MGKRQANKPMSGAERAKRWRDTHPENREREAERGRQRRATDTAETKERQREQSRLRAAAYRARKKAQLQAALDAAEQAQAPTPEDKRAERAARRSGEAIPSTPPDLGAALSTSSTPEPAEATVTPAAATVTTATPAAEATVTTPAAEATVTTATPAAEATVTTPAAEATVTTATPAEGTVTTATPAAATVTTPQPVASTSAGPPTPESTPRLKAQKMSHKRVEGVKWKKRFCTHILRILLWSFNLRLQLTEPKKKPWSRRARTQRLEINALKKTITSITSQKDQLEREVLRLQKENAKLQKKCSLLQTQDKARQSACAPTPNSISLIQAPMDPDFLDDIHNEPSPRKRARMTLESGNAKLINASLVLGAMYADELGTRKKSEVPDFTKRRLGAVISKVTKKYRGKFGKKSVFGRITKRKSTATKKRNLVIEFLKRPDNSTTLPGKKDAMSVGRGKDKVQVYVLNDYIQKLHEKFIEEQRAKDKPINMSLTTFKNARPVYMKPVSLAKAQTCLCSKHQNFALLLDRLCKTLGREKVPLMPDTFVKEIDTKQKLARLLDEFKQITNSEGTTTIKFQQWAQKKGMERTDLCDEEVGVTQFLRMVSEQYPIFIVHKNLVQNQYASVKLLKQRLGKNACTIQMDFAQNYTCRSGEQVQNAHWNPVQVTLHPIVVHYKDDNDELQHKSYVMVVESKEHGPATVFAIIDRFAIKLKNDLPQIDHVTYLTDSPTSQYRNKQMMHVLRNHEEYFGTSANWLYFESGHGKGPCDGVGGACKRRADQAVHRDKTLKIHNAREFHKWATRQDTHSKIDYLYVSAAGVKSFQYRVDHEFQPAIPGIMKAHAAMVRGTSIFTRDRSCYESCCWDAATNTFKGGCQGWTEHPLSNAPRITARQSAPAGRKRAGRGRGQKRSRIDNPKL